jgi:TP901 family phage tail tape measure protein
MASKVASFEVVVNGIPVVLKNMQEVEDLMKRVKKEGKNANLGSDKLDKYTKAQARLMAQQQRSRDAVRRLRNENLALDKTYRGASAKLTALRARYKDLAIQNKENTRVGRALLKSIIDLDNRLKGLDDTVGQSQRKVGGYFGSLKRFSIGVLGVGSAITVLSRGISSSFKTLIKFEEQIADIRKVTSLGAKDAKKFALAIGDIDTRTSADNLLQLAVAGGRLGLTGNELLEFTRSTDQAFVALGDTLEGSAEQIGLTLGKIASNFGVDENGIGPAIQAIGSALNELGAKTKAQEGNIIDFTNRVAGVAVQAGLTIPQVASLGALFDATGQSIEVAATTLNKLLPAIAANDEKFARIAGVTLPKFRDVMRNDAFGALRLVSKGAKSSEQGLVGLQETIEGFGIRAGRAASIVGILANEQDQLTDLLLIAEPAFEVATSLLEEFAIKNETVEANMKKMTREWGQFIKELNSGNGPISAMINGLTELGRGFIRLFRDINTGDRNLFKFLFWNDPVEQGEADAAVADIKKKLTLAVEESGNLLSLTDGIPEFKQALLDANYTKKAAERISQEFYDGLQDGLTKNKSKIDPDLIVDGGTGGGGGGGTGGSKKLKTFLEGSLAYLKDQIKKINKEIAESNDETFVAAGYDAVVLFEAKLKDLEEQYRALRREAEGFVVPELLDKLPTIRQVTELAPELGIVPNDADKREVDRFRDSTHKVDEILGFRSEDDQATQEEKDKAAAEKRIELEKYVKGELINIAGSTATAIFDLEKEAADRKFTAELSAVEGLYARKIEAAEGDVQLQKGLENELVEERKKIEERAAKQRKKIAIKEAIIQTALAIVEALPNPFAAAFAAAAGAVQIATISSQKFAAGGYTGQGAGGRDSTGERPVNAQLHEGEYVMRRSVLETPEGKAMAARSEQLSGRGSNISASLAGLRFGESYKRRHSLKSSFAVGGFSTAPVGLATKSNITVSLDNNTLESMGLHVRDGSAQGSAQGTKEGITSGNEESRLISQVEKDTNI